MDETLQRLRVSDDPQAGRELLFLYEECAWRATRLGVLRELHRFGQPRVLEFLMRVATAQDDIPLCEAAIESLGRSKARVAARFLAASLDTCIEPVKPAVIVALGRLGELSVASRAMSLSGRPCRYWRTRWSMRGSARCR